MLTLVRQARRRILHNELFAQGTNACCAALAAFIVLLLVGAQILNWQWLVPIPVAALAFGIWQARKRVPTPYRTAQIVDRRMGLSDTLSTALFFFEAPADRHSDEIRRCQRERAEEAARGVDVRRAVPYTTPRAVYAMAALVLVASSLFALRYGLTRSLDLKQPLASMLRQQFGWEPRTEVAKETRRTPPGKADSPDDTPASAENSDPGQPEPQADSEQSDPQEGAQQQADNKKGAQKDGGAKKAENGDEKGADQEPQPENADASNSQNQQNNGQQNKGDRQQTGSQQQAASSGDNSSLLSKVKDAWQNLLSRVKPQNGQSPQQQAQNQANKQPGKGQPNGSKQQSAKNAQQQTGQQDGDPQDGQTGDQAKAQQQDPQGKGAGKSDSQQASKQPGSGIGSQDGDKSIKQAEQLAAMGKISEILGKRSANISGEATVEVQSTSQQLHTAYVNRGAEHTQGGAEISRDEVPVALQAYVEQYFEQIRKQPPAAQQPKKQ